MDLSENNLEQKRLLSLLDHLPPAAAENVLLTDMQKCKAEVFIAVSLVKLERSWHESKTCLQKQMKNKDCSATL